MPSGATGLSAELRAAQARLRGGDVAGAEHDAEALCQLHPDSPEAFALHAAAAARRDSAAGLQLWRGCAARFADNPAAWRLGLAHALLANDMLAEAEALFAAALMDDPGALPALAGRALTVSRARPAEAEALWQDLEARAPAGLEPGWRVARARALAASGDAEQAYGLVRLVLDGDAGFRPAHNALARLLMDTGAHAAARTELASGVLRDGSAAPVDRLRLQNWLGDIPAARESFASGLNDARRPADLAALFEAVPMTFETHGRAQAWRALQARLGKAHDSGLAAHTLALRLDLALRDYEGFLTRLETGEALPPSWENRFHAVAEKLRAAEFPDFLAPRVFGIGLSKTGTSSLGQALQILGYAQAHFLNPFTSEILSEEDFPLFDAATDIPVTMRFETLYHSYPNAKFILTERNFDDWAGSIERHFQQRYGTSDFALLRQQATKRNRVRFGADFARSHAALYYVHGNAAAAWRAHDNRVTEFFAAKPAGKLLRLNVFSGGGWPEVCAFLNRPVPAEAFPWANRRSGGAA